MILLFLLVFPCEAHISKNKPGFDKSDVNFKPSGKYHWVSAFSTICVMKLLAMLLHYRKDSLLSQTWAHLAVLCVLLTNFRN